MKICPNCGNPGEFSKSSRTPDGLQVHCKACQKEAARLAKLAKRIGIWRDGRTMRQIEPEIKKANKKAYFEANKQHIKELGKNWRAENKEYLNKQKNEDAKKSKEQGISAYGGKCQCCGEFRPQFLTIDHTEGRGAACYADIEPNGVRYSGMRLWQILRRAGWPKTGYALLCFNCNCAKGAFGVCPHQTEREKK